MEYIGEADRSGTNHEEWQGREYIRPTERSSHTNSLSRQDHGLEDGQGMEYIRQAENSSNTNSVSRQDHILEDEQGLEYIQQAERSSHTNFASRQDHGLEDEQGLEYIRQAERSSHTNFFSLQDHRLEDGQGLEYIRQAERSSHTNFFSLQDHRLEDGQGLEYIRQAERSSHTNFFSLQDHRLEDGQGLEYIRQAERSSHTNFFSLQSERFSNTNSVSRQYHRLEDGQGLENSGEAATRVVPPSSYKQVPPAASEVEAGGSGRNGGELVHFDGPIVFTAEDLLRATTEIMGRSTYGTFYKATLKDGNQVAVKRLREELTKNPKEFEEEVNVIGKVRHPNLLAMRAYYMEPKGEKLLVFDYMPKGSLKTYLHDRSPDTPIDWLTRMKIMQEIAKGLLHLHNNANMIHGNLTSSNVVLDEHTNAKVADFGLARLMKREELTLASFSNVIARAVSRMKRANRKTDVYSLGVIILELLTGKSGGEGADLPQWVAFIVKEESTNEVFDLELMKDASAIGDELLNTLKLALHCVDPLPSSRPEVQEVLQQLEEIRTQTTPTSGDGAAAGPSTAV